MVYTPVPALAPGDPITATDWNTWLKDNSVWVATHKGCLLTRSGPQTMTEWALVGFDVEIVDTDGYHDPVGANNYKVLIPAGLGGYYHVFGNVLFAANAVGLRKLVITDGVTAFAIHYIPGFAAGSHSLIVEVTRYLAAGASVYLFTHQTSGGNLNILQEAGTPLLGVQYIGQ